MGFSIDQAAKKIGVPYERYESWEKGEKQPTYKQLEDLAEKVYRRPLALLLLKSPPHEEPIQRDFRNLSNSEIQNLSPDLRLALRKVKRYQLILEEVVTKEDYPKFKHFNISIEDNAIEASLRFREFLGLTIEEQKSWKPESAFANFRKYIESIGVYVFMLKFPIEDARAFCLTGDFPIIVLNSEDSRNATIFSLFHEMCHILFNQNDVFKDAKNGDLIKEYKEIEAFCNTFSASFLVPDFYFNQDVFKYSLVKGSVTDGQITALSRMYNVSNEVIARKLIARNLITEDFFWTKKYAWDSLAKEKKKLDNEKLKDNDQGLNQGIRVIYAKGRPYVSSVVNAYEKGLISSSDLSNYLETKFNHLPKILDRLNG